MRVSAIALRLFFCALGARAIDDGEDCAEDGTDYEYSEAIVGSSKTIRKISTNHCPNHPFFKLNPHTAIATATARTGSALGLAPIGTTSPEVLVLAAKVSPPSPLTGRALLTLSAVIPPCRSWPSPCSSPRSRWACRPSVV